MAHALPYGNAPDHRKMDWRAAFQLTGGPQRRQTGSILPLAAWAHSTSTNARFRSEVRSGAPAGAVPSTRGDETGTGLVSPPAGSRGGGGSLELLVDLELPGAAEDAVVVQVDGVRAAEHDRRFLIREVLDIDRQAQTLQQLHRGVVRHAVGQAAAKLRSFRPPEPYAGKGEDGKQQTPKYGIVGMLPKKTHVAAKDLVVEAMNTLLKENDNATVSSDKKFCRNGDDHEKSDTYGGHWLVSARETKKL